MSLENNGHTGMVCMMGVAGGREGTPQGRRRGRAPGGTGSCTRTAALNMGMTAVVDVHVPRVGPNHLIDRRRP